MDPKYQNKIKWYYCCFFTEILGNLGKSWKILQKMSAIFGISDLEEHFTKQKGKIYNYWFVKNKTLLQNEKKSKIAVNILDSKYQNKIKWYFRCRRPHILKMYFLEEKHIKVSWLSLTAAWQAIHGNKLHPLKAI